MSSRREVLIGRFRAGSLDRIRKVCLTLIEIAHGRGTHEQLAEVAREIHTLKGEARMLGFAEVSDVAHVSEGLLGGRDQLPSPEQCKEIVRALELIGGALRGELGDEAEMRLALARGREDLHRALESESEPESSRATATVAVTSGAAGSPAGEEAARPRVHDRWVQVNARRVDELCERVSDFEMDFNSIQQALRDLFRGMPENVARLGRPLLEDLDRAQNKLQDITTGSWALRLVPVAPTLEELASHAHDLAVKLGKRVRVSVHGGDAQIERTVLDAVWEPLLHLVRNAIDHGIELPAERGAKPAEGALKLQAESIGASVVVSVGDDGRGVDAHKVRDAALARGLISREAVAALGAREVMELLFLHGFSTRAEVNELSGRGVGLDVVRGTVEALGGSATLNSVLSQGTQISLTLPATIGKERVLIVNCGGVLYGLPSRNVVEVIAASSAAVETVAGGRIIRHRDTAVPLRSMSMALSGAPEVEAFILILSQGTNRYAFSVPSLLGDRELVRRPVDAIVAAAVHVHASGSLSDGRLVLLLTVLELLRRSEDTLDALPLVRSEAERRMQVLVVDDSPIIREVVTEIIRGDGMDPHPMPDAQAALGFLEEHHPDVALLDVDMPGMDGFELLRRIRLRSQRLPVIMLTTRASAEDKRRASSLGADAYVVKAEFLEGTLLKTVRRFAKE